MDEKTELGFSSEEDKKECFDAFIDEYKEKTLVEKQDIVIQELKELIALMKKISSDENIKTDMIINREVLDINKEGYSEDDYIEAVYVYLHAFKDIFATYFLEKK